MIDDLRHFSAPRAPWMTLAMLALFACALAIPDNAAQQGGAKPANTSTTGHFPGPVVAAPMPAAAPIFEPAHALERLSPPVQCSGRSRHGLWIAHSGDRKRTGRRCI